MPFQALRLFQDPQAKVSDGVGMFPCLWQCHSFPHLWASAHAFLSAWAPFHPVPSNTSLFVTSLTSFTSFQEARTLAKNVDKDTFLNAFMVLYLPSYLSHLTTNSLRIGKMSLWSMYAHHPHKTHSTASSQWMCAKWLKYFVMEDSTVSSPKKSTRSRNSFTRDTLPCLLGPTVVWVSSLFPT